MTHELRLARPDDAPAIQAIYAPIVADTAISFEVQVPSIAEMRERIERTLTTHPWLVADVGGAVGGYTYAGVFRTRAAYQWCADVSVYVAEQHRRRGFARELYSVLFEILLKQGYCTLHAGITLPNPASVRFHEFCGFKQVGVLRDVGFKLGAWHDVGVFQREWRERIASPQPPIPFGEMNRELIETTLSQKRKA